MRGSRYDPKKATRFNGEKCTYVSATVYADEMGKNGPPVLRPAAQLVPIVIFSVRRFARLPQPPKLRAESDYTKPALPISAIMAQQLLQLPPSAMACCGWKVKLP